MLHVIEALLAPVFLLGGISDPDAARESVRDTIEAYHPATDQDRLAVARFVAFSLAALGAVGQSMAPDLPVALAVRLRANAAACHRAAEQARRALARTQAAIPPQDAAQQTAAAQAQKPQPTDIDRAAWATAMAHVAREYATDLPNLPPQQKRAASMRANALGTAASSLLGGGDPAPFRPPI
jgi:hypothetical protein